MSVNLLLVLLQFYLSLWANPIHHLEIGECEYRPATDVAVCDTSVGEMAARWDDAGDAVIRTDRGHEVAALRLTADGVELIEY